jgi:hypothetical protein
MFGVIQKKMGKLDGETTTAARSRKWSKAIPQLVFEVGVPTFSSTNMAGGTSCLCCLKWEHGGGGAEHGL